MNLGSVIKDAALYPLRLECITLILGSSVALYCLFILSLTSYVISGGAPVYFFGVVIWFYAFNTIIEYGLDIADRTAQGDREPPVLRADILHPFLGERRFLKQLLIILVLVSLAYKFEQAGYPALTFVSLTALILITPASLMISTVTAGIEQMVNPLAILRLAAGVGLLYFAPVALLCLIVAWFYCLLTGVIEAVLFSIVAMHYLIFLFFHVLGCCVYHRRNNLGYRAEQSPETAHEYESKIQHKELDEKLMTAYRLSNVDEVKQAEQIILPWFEKDPKYLFERIDQWPNRNLINRLSNRYIESLIDQKRYAQALEICRRCLSKDDRYSPWSPAGIERMAPFAATVAEVELLRCMIRNFLSDNPGHPYTARLSGLAKTLDDAPG